MRSVSTAAPKFPALVSKSAPARASEFPPEIQKELDHLRKLHPRMNEHLLRNMLAINAAKLSEFNAAQGVKGFESCFPSVPVAVRLIRPSLDDFQRRYFKAVGEKL